MLSPDSALDWSLPSGGGSPSLGQPHSRAGDPCSALCTQSFLSAGDGVGVGQVPMPQELTTRGEDRFLTLGPRTAPP